MRAFLYAVACLFITFAAFAQDGAVSSAPPETVSVTYVILFAVIFVGMIVGFFWYLWRNDEKSDGE